MRKKFLLGATKYGELVFGEFEITNRNKYPEFSASFDAVRPFDGFDIDLKDYFENYIEDIGKECAYELCEKYRCSPQELASELADECNDPRDALDCSLYPEEIVVRGHPWYFESGSCGQHDTRGEMEEYVNKEAYDLLHSLWDKYHCTDIRKFEDEDGVRKSIDAIIAAFNDIDEEKWIEDYIYRSEKCFREG